MIQQSLDLQTDAPPPEAARKAQEPRNDAEGSLSHPQPVEPVQTVASVHHWGTATVPPSYGDALADYLSWYTGTR